MKIEDKSQRPLSSLLGNKISKKVEKKEVSKKLRVLLTVLRVLFCKTKAGGEQQQREEPFRVDCSAD